MTKYALRISMVMVEVANSEEEAKMQAIAFVKHEFPLQTRTLRCDAIKEYDHEKEYPDQGI